MKTIIPYVLLAGLIVYMVLSPVEKEIVDNTDYYEAKTDSLINLNEAHVRMIKTRDNLIEEKKRESDSLISYQNKIYKYYDNILENLDTLSDNDQYELFFTLTDN